MSIVHFITVARKMSRHEVRSPARPTVLACLDCIAEGLDQEMDGEQLVCEKEWWPIELAPFEVPQTCYDVFRPVYWKENLVALLLRRK